MHSCQPMSDLYPGSCGKGHPGGPGEDRQGCAKPPSRVHGGHGLASRDPAELRNDRVCVRAGAAQ